LGSVASHRHGTPAADWFVFSELHGTAPTEIRHSGLCSHGTELQLRESTMNESLKVQPHHLERAAYLYIRQSSMRQVVENIESTKRQ